MTNTRNSPAPKRATCAYTAIAFAGTKKNPTIAPAQMRSFQNQRPVCMPARKSDPLVHQKRRRACAEKKEKLAKLKRRATCLLLQRDWRPGISQ
jgi:hypothetical protein